MNWFEGTESKWIKAGIGDAAPCFFAKFNCPSPDGVRVAICGLGYYELQINGRKVGDRELAPIVSIYDRRARYHVLDVANYLQPGENAVGVILGHGWYNQNVTDAWNFGNVSWRDRPKLRFEIRDAAGNRCGAEPCFRGDGNVEGYPCRPPPLTNPVPGRLRPTHRDAGSSAGRRTRSWSCSRRCWPSRS